MLDGCDGQLLKAATLPSTPSTVLDSRAAKELKTGLRARLFCLILLLAKAATAVD